MPALIDTDETRMSEKLSPKMGYEEPPNTAQKRALSCTERPRVLSLDQEQNPSDGLAERLEQVKMTSTSSSPVASDQIKNTCCYGKADKKENTSDLDCCRNSSPQISGDKIPKSSIEHLASSTEHNTKPLADINCPVSVAAVGSTVKTSSSAPESLPISQQSSNSQIPSLSALHAVSDSNGSDSGRALVLDSSVAASAGAANARAAARGPTSIPLEENFHEEQELREACGVFGFVLAQGEEPPPHFSIARTIMDGLVALQHRGQESAGIVTSEGRGCKQFKHHRGLGLVSSVFSPEKLAPLTGILGLGHTRYSTAGGSDLGNVQPFMVHTRHGQLAIAHNGELINADTLRKTVLERGVGLSTHSDSELITQILSLTPLRGEHHGEADWRARIRHLMEATPTSYSLALMNEDKIYAVRDPFGNRPLCVGMLRELDEEGISLAGGESSRVLGYVLSSESCAFTSVGATFMREVMPGEIIELSPTGVRRIDLVFRPQTCRPLSLLEEVPYPTNGDSKTSHHNGSPTSLTGTHGSLPYLHDIENVPPAFCIFEYVYFARPDSIFEGQQVYSVRQRSGRQLAREAPVDVDIVSCVPESATPAAMGFAMELKLPYVEVLYKSRYVGRTFIQPCVTSRKRSVAHKFAAIAENVRGKRVVLVDDSVVRGTTIRPIVKLIRDAGAKEVHFRVASPPIRYPCYMGINIPTREELVANRMPFDQLAEYFCVDSLQYLSIEGLEASVKEGAKSMMGETIGHCTACLSGRYPVKKEY